MKEVSNLNIIFYGERGIVNSIVLDMGSDINKQKQFLKTIKFKNDSIKNWIDQIKVFRYIIEPCFAQFGSPDLIIVAEEENGEHHVLFIEAKVCAYNDASEKIGTDLWPQTYRGTTSKLNIQLALKYRFAQNYPLFENNNSIIEDESYTRAEYNDKKRALKKTSVISLCREFFGKNPNFLFVALTNDNKDIAPFLEREFLPAIGTNNWNDDKEKFGIVSFEMLEKNGIVNKKMGYYSQASQDFLYSPANIGAGPNDRHIRTVNMSKWDIKIYSELEILYENFKISLTSGEIEKLEGSYSIKSRDGRTIVKLFSENGQIQIAFRNDNLPDFLANDKERINIGVGSSAKSFVLVYSEIEQITEEIEKNIIEFVENNMGDNVDDCSW